MRTVMVLTLVTSLSGCMVEVLTTTAIQGELASEAAETATHQLTRTQDQQSRLQLQQSVNAYASLNGSFPTTVEELVPDYLREIPRTTGGLAFLYDPSSGTVQKPAQAWPNATQNATPATPTRTGSAAGQIENITTDSTRRQLEALDDLDL